MRKNIIVLIACFCAMHSSCWASLDWREEQDVYKKIDNASLRLMDGDTIHLHQLIEERPLVVAFIFTRCSGVCYPFLLQLKDQLNQYSQSSDLNVLVVSFDPWDTIEDMKRMASFLQLEDEPQWKFAVTSDIEKLTASVSFYPVWNKLIQQFDHDALLVGVNTSAYITKKLYGLGDKKDFELLMMSIKNDFIVTYRMSTANKIFSCFNYDPKTGKRTLGPGLLFIALPSVITFFTLIGIRWAVRK